MAIPFIGGWLQRVQPAVYPYPSVGIPLDFTPQGLSEDEGPEPVKGSGCSADESAASPKTQTKQYQCGDDNGRRPSLSNLVGQGDQQARHQAFPVLPVRSRTVVTVVSSHENFLIEL